MKKFQFLKDKEKVPKVLRQNKLLSDFNEYIPRGAERINRTTRSSHGKTIIIDSSDYHYSIERVAKNSKKTAWQCRSKKSGCKGRITTLDNYIIRFTNSHNHPPPPNEDY